MAYGYRTRLGDHVSCSVAPPGDRTLRPDHTNSTARRRPAMHVCGLGSVRTTGPASRGSGPAPLSSCTLPPHLRPTRVDPAMWHLWRRLGERANGLCISRIWPRATQLLHPAPAPAPTRVPPAMWHLWPGLGGRTNGTWRGRGEVSCSAAARRGPLDLCTRRVPNPQGHQRILRPGLQGQPGRRMRHCCARQVWGHTCRAQQAEPPPWCNRSVCPPGVRVACREVSVRSGRMAIRRAPICVRDVAPSWRV